MIRVLDSWVDLGSSTRSVRQRLDPSALYGWNGERYVLDATAAAVAALGEPASRVFHEVHWLETTPEQEY